MKITVPTLKVEVCFDLVCPWCLIGKRELAAALAEFTRQWPDVPTAVVWHGYPLMPDTPAAGVPFAEFYRRRLGSDEAVAARQAQVRAAGHSAGAAFAFERIAVFPNTLAAHRLVRHAGRTHGATVQQALIERLFDGYFARGENIGDADVLLAAATSLGLDERECAALLSAASADDEALLQQREDWHRRGVHGVPHFIVNGVALAGAQRKNLLLRAMQHAVAAEVLG